MKFVCCLNNKCYKVIGLKRFIPVFILICDGQKLNVNGLIAKEEDGITYICKVQVFYSKPHLTFCCCCLRVTTPLSCWVALSTHA